MTVEINGSTYAIDVPGARLLDFVRELGLTAAKEGCGEGDCGACTVLVDGEPHISCMTLVGTVEGKSVITAEGVDSGFEERCETFGGVQCGFCTPGFTVMDSWIRSDGTETGTETIPKLLEGNLCRCTGYLQLLAALEAPS